MSSVSKSYSLVLILILASSSLMIAGSVSGQSLKPLVTDFSLQYVDNSYDVPPSSKSTKDLYTGEVTTSTIPGYQVENKSIVVTVKNPSGVDAYNFRWKAHNDNFWFYDPFNPDDTLPFFVSDTYGVPTYASNSEYTVISLTFIPKSLTSVDVQVQALYGDYRADPYGHVIPLPGGPTYDFYFDGQASYWSNTQTLTIGNNVVVATPTPIPTSSPILTPTQISTATNQPSVEIDNLLGFSLEITLLVIIVVVIALAVAVVVLARRHRKTTNLSK